MLNDKSTPTPSTNTSNRDKRIFGICNGFDCSNSSKTKIVVSCGKFGTISLDLCENCAKLFME